jgi:hypothetical protein
MKINDIKAQELVGSSVAERTYFFPALSKHKLPQIVKTHGGNFNSLDILNKRPMILKQENDINYVLIM